MNLLVAIAEGGEGAVLAVLGVGGWGEGGVGVEYFSDEVGELAVERVVALLLIVGDGFVAQMDGGHVGVGVELDVVECWHDGG